MLAPVPHAVAVAVVQFSGGPLRCFRAIIVVVAAPPRQLVIAGWVGAAALVGEVARVCACFGLLALLHAVSFSGVQTTKTCNVERVDDDDDDDGDR